MEHRSAAWAGVLGLVSAAPAGDYASFTEEAEKRGLAYTYPLGGGAAGDAIGDRGEGR